jgi:hypothetical protein
VIVSLAALSGDNQGPASFLSKAEFLIAGAVDIGIDRMIVAITVSVVVGIEPGIEIPIDCLV